MRLERRSERTESRNEYRPLTPFRFLVILGTSCRATYREPKGDCRTMAEHEEGQGKRRGGLAKLMALLAAIGAVLTVLAFWRRRRASPEE